MPFCRFFLRVSADQLLAYYRGEASQVVVRADNGQRVSFPAAQLRRFATHQGVEGYFELQFTDDHRLVAMRQLR